MTRECNLSRSRDEIESEKLIATRRRGRIISSLYNSELLYPRVVIKNKLSVSSNEKDASSNEICASCIFRPKKLMTSSMVLEILLVFIRPLIHHSHWINSRVIQTLLFLSLLYLSLQLHLRNLSIGRMRLLCTWQFSMEFLLLFFRRISSSLSFIFIFFFFFSIFIEYQLYDISLVRIRFIYNLF